MSDNKKEQKEVRFDFEGKEYLVKSLTSKQLSEGRRVYTQAFKKAIDEGAILKKSLEDHIRKQGIWDDGKQEEYLSLIKKSADLEYKIKSGTYKTASELKQKALELKKLRLQTTSLASVRDSMDAVTAEGMADNRQFNYFVSCSVLDFLTQKPVYSSVDEYESEADSKLAEACAAKFASFFYGLEEDYTSTFLENKLLKKLNLLDDKGFLVDSNKRRVDEEGNLIDGEGARIDSEGNRIDINNNPIIDDDALDSLEFVDDLSGTEKPVKTAAKPKRKKQTDSPVT
jgi:hypothetical protein